MNEKRKKLEEKERELRKRIEQCKEQRDNVECALKKLKNRYHIGEIDYSRYHVEFKETFKDKTPKQWVSYYDINLKTYKSQLKWCENQIKLERVKSRSFSGANFKEKEGKVKRRVRGRFAPEDKRQNQLIAEKLINLRVERSKRNWKRKQNLCLSVKKIGFVALFVFLGIALFYAFQQFGITGLTVQLVEETHTDNLDLEVSESYSYGWEPENPGIILSSQISGKIIGRGHVRIYLDGILILDSKDLEVTKTLITGSGITGFTAEEGESEGEGDSGEDSGGDSDESEESSDDSGDDSGGDSEESESDDGSDEVEESGEPGGEIKEGEEEDVEEPEEDVTEIPEEEESEEEEPRGGDGEEQEQGPGTIVKEFSNYCEETCDISSLNLSKTSYIIRIEVSGDVELELDNIKYKVLIEREVGEPEEEITKEPRLIQNIPEITIEKNSYYDLPISNYMSQIKEYYLLQVENITITSFDHTVRILPDENFIGTRVGKIIGKNEFGTVESNSFNITVIEKKVDYSPILLKDIPDLFIKKGDFIEIRLSDYIEGAEEYFLLQTTGISTTTFGHLLRITPDEEFTGTGTSKIIATNEFGTLESNFFNITVSEENITEIPEANITIHEINITNISISTLQYKAVINRPQKWVQIVRAEKTEDIKNLTLKLPKQAQNISVKTGEEVDQVLTEIEDYENTIENADKESLIEGTITGNVALDIENSEGVLTSLLDWLKQITITGRVIEEQDLQEEITETEDEKIIDLEQIVEQTQTTGLAVEYYTEGPQAIEETLPRGKRVIVSSATELNLTDILTFTEIPEKFKTGEENRIKVFWREQNNFVESFAYDLDNNGFLDYVEWITPHLSNQTFDIILITKAEHLDENRNFISDIYEEVKALDNEWSEAIPSTHYVRVTFEQNLTPERDITLYPRTLSGSPKIEVYELGGAELIAEFSSLEDNQYNKVYLTDLEGSQDTFDLLVLNGEIQIDHMIDPLLTLRPDAAGESTQWDLGAGASNHEAVDEESADDDTTYVYQSSTSDEDDLYSISTNAALAGATIHNVTVYAVAKSVKSGSGSVSAQPFYILVRPVSGGTTYADAGRAPATSYTSYSNTWTNNPADSQPWEKEDIDNLQVGIRGKTDTGGASGRHQPSVTQVYVVVDYTEAPDNEYPLFSTYWDDNATLVSTGTGSFNVTISSTNGTVLLEINNTNITATNLTADVYNASHAFTSEGTYAYRWHSWGNGTDSNYNISTEQSYTVNITSDTTPPNISIISPLEETNTTDTGIDVNYTVSSDAQACWYSNDTYTYNETLASCANITGVTWALGQHNVTVWANDSTGNENSSSVTFTILESVTVNCTILDPYGNPVNITVNITDLSDNETEYQGGGNQHQNTLEKGKEYRFEIWPVNHTILEIEFEVNLTENITDIVSIYQANSSQNFSFSLNPILNNTNYTITANGTALQAGADGFRVLEKCADWNFTISNCTGSWTPYAALKSDGTYEFTINFTDPGFREGVTNCTAENNDAKGTWPDPCDGSYPAACPGEGGTDYLSCDDGSYESQDYHEQGSGIAYEYAGVRIQEYNTSVTDCVSITKVEICYEQWYSGSVPYDCDVSVSQNGTDWVAVNTTCPGSGANPGVTCEDVTSDESWNCTNFFDSSGTRARAKTEAVTDDNNGVGVLYTDVFFFNVTYAGPVDNTPPDISITSPANNTNTTDTGLDVNYTVSDETSLDSCWYSNDTYSSNTSLGTGGSCTNITITWADGQHNVTVWANDSSNNVNSSSVTFTIDSTPPSVASLTETPADSPDYVSGTTYEFNATVTGGTLSAVLIEFDGTNYTPSNPVGDVYNFTIQDLAAGAYS
ncbi:MAG: hypothetical protein ABIH92_02835, partial [Nanoarchaeota archaeon]